MNTLKNKKIHRITILITAITIIFIQQVRFTTIVYGSQIPATPNLLNRNQDSNIGRYTDTNGIIYDYNLNDFTATVVGFLGSDRDIIILDSFTVDNNIFTVTTIGNRAFAHQQITNVTIPNAITTIGDWAFGHNSLTTLTIPNSVISIGINAFNSNRIEGIVNIPDSIITMGEGVFAFNQISAVTIGNAITNIPNYAFHSNLLEEVIIPDSVTTIEFHAFSNNQIRELTIGNSVNTIENNAFHSNQLTKVIIPDSVITVGHHTFSFNQIRELNIGNSLTTIELYAFGDNQLTNVILPNSLTTIGEDAFFNNQLESIVIPNSVTAIGGWAFASNSLTNITIPSSVTSIGNSIFSRCPLEIIYTDDGHAETLKDLLQPSVMNRISVEATEIWEGPSHYASHVLLENTVAIGEDITLEAIPQIKYVHDNSTAYWHAHLPEVKWYKNNEPIAEANQLLLPLQAVDKSDEGIYYAIVDGERLEDIELIIVPSDETKQPDGIEPNEPENNNPQDPKQKEDDKHEAGINEDIATSDDIRGLLLYSSIGILALISMVYTIKKRSKNF